MIAGRNRDRVWRRNARFALFFLLTASCASPPRNGYETAIRVSGEPVEFETLEQPYTVAEIEDLGNRIYVYDRAVLAASTALDDVSNAVRRKISGRIVIGDSNPLVRFLTDDLRSIVDVEVDYDHGNNRMFLHDPPVELDSEQVIMARARRLALEVPVRACTPAYADVVLEGTREDAAVWIVYLIATSDDPDQVILGGHHRIFVDREASRVLDHQALSRSCMPLMRDPTAVSFSISNFGIRLPLETHVFTSLGYDVELGVFNERGSWTITEGRIRQRRSHDPNPKADQHR